MNIEEKKAGKEGRVGFRKMTSAERYCNEVQRDC